MISQTCFSREYIQEQRDRLDGGDLIIIDKSIHALALLGHLAETDLSFIFKGGTSLLLHLPEIRRLSIDIDIMCSAGDGEIDRIVTHLASCPPFTRQEENVRGARGLPERRHFKFFYLSSVTGREEYILLDVVQEDSCQLECIEKPIAMELLQVEREVNVRVPTVEALLGDKLTAFAPHTIGVPFHTDRGDSMSMQVVKQLYDTGELFSVAQDLEAVKQAYQEGYRLENIYRGGSWSMQQTLDDTKRVALQLCCNGFPYAHRDDGVITNIQDGATRLRDHLVRGRFRLIQEGKLAAAKAYLMASYIEGSADLTADQLAFDLNTQLEFIQSANIADPACLNRMKQTAPEAFYYMALATGT